MFTIINALMFGLKKKKDALFAIKTSFDLFLTFQD
jgi:hypothetical protein